MIWNKGSRSSVSVWTLLSSCCWAGDSVPATSCAAWHMNQIEVDTCLGRKCHLLKKIQSCTWLINISKPLLGLKLPILESSPSPAPPVYVNHSIIPFSPLCLSPLILIASAQRKATICLSALFKALFQILIQYINTWYINFSYCCFLTAEPLSGTSWT